MNQFEKRMNALRLQFKAEQRQITVDSYHRIARLNTAIGQATIQEAREILRAEKHKEYEAMRRTHELNRKCYLQQIELIEDEQRVYLEKNPSNHKLRRMMAMICEYAESKGQKSFNICFGNNRNAAIVFD